MKNRFFVFCKRNNVDAFYNCLKKLTIHFGILEINGNSKDLFSHLSKLEPVRMIRNVKDIKKIATQIQSGKPICSEYTPCIEDFDFAFIIFRLPYFTQQLLLFIEHKINNLVPKTYTYKISYHSSENEFRKFPIYGPSVISSKSKRILIVEKSHGYGDCMLTMPLITGFAAQLKEQGYQVFFWHYYQQSYLLYKTLLSKFRHSICMYSDSVSSLSQLPVKQDSYYKIFNMDSLIIHSSFTKIKETAEWISYNSYKNIKLDHIIAEWKYPKVEKCIYKRLMEMRSTYRYLIGVQFDTEHNQDCTYTRRWHVNHVNAYLDMCKRANIGTINLAPYQTGAQFLKCDLDVSELSIIELLPIVRSLDAVVGIDSCFGHMAGIMKKPNLTLWGKIIHNKSQRTYSNNYSLIPLDGKTDSLSARLVLQRTKQILFGMLPLSSENDCYNFDSNVEYVTPDIID